MFVKQTSRFPCGETDTQKTLLLIYTHLLFVKQARKIHCHSFLSDETNSCKNHYIPFYEATQTHEDDPYLAA